ncbi:hypothetical protein C5C49_02400 [Rathayibacter sp. AY1E2]|nr:hypothetical protein C5C49_02400 [Rathayibacter sp. AY1E2]
MTPTAPSPTGLRRRRGGAVVVVAALVGLLLGGSVDGTRLAAVPSEPQTVRLWTFLQPGPVAADFDPGDLISDEVFFDGDALGPLTVQAFLDARVPDCAGGPVPCLRDSPRTPRRSRPTSSVTRFPPDATSRPRRSSPRSPARAG